MCQWVSRILRFYAYHGVHSEGVLQEIARLARAN